MISTFQFYLSTLYSLVNRSQLDSLQFNYSFQIELIKAITMSLSAKLFSTVVKTTDFSSPIQCYFYNDKSRANIAREI